ncbi:MAG: outer membrane beta-barrel domain-containing protein [bacterium]
MKVLVGVIFLLTTLCNCWAAEDSKYNFTWLDPDKEVYVLQNRKFRKDGKFSFSALGGITTSGAFADAKVAQFRAGYFFQEDWGIELLYSKNFSEVNDNYNAIRQSGTAAFVRKGVGYYGGMLKWSPFYAKINTFNKIFYFDWIFGLGIASFTDENNMEEMRANPTQNWLEETHTGIVWNTGLRFYVTEAWSVRMDLTTIHYEAIRYAKDESDDQQTYFSNYDLLVGINYSL